MSVYLHDIQAAIERGKKEDIGTACVYDTVFSHDQTGDNYVWLQPKYGKLLWVEFEEPAGSGVWRHYDRYYWARHGCVVSHDPDRLVEEHVRYYVDPETKRINLRFWFEDPAGRVHPVAPTREFYQLEADYFRQHQLCQGAVLSPHTDTPVCAPPLGEGPVGRKGQRFSFPE